MTQERINAECRPQLHQWQCSEKKSWTGHDRGRLARSWCFLDSSRESGWPTGWPQTIASFGKITNVIFSDDGFGLAKQSGNHPENCWRAVRMKCLSDDHDLCTKIERQRSGSSREDTKTKMKKLILPSDSPGLSPRDFWPSGLAKTSLGNRRFVDSDDIIEGLTDLFDSVTFDELQRLFQSWIRRSEWVIRNSREHFTE
jgi:hypothetical protein